jgi:hypothetical protein
MAIARLPVDIFVQIGMLVLATGAEPEMRQSLGTAVFSGMIGVMLFGIFLTPVFFFVLLRLGGRQPERGRGLPETEAIHFTEEDEKARHFPA